MSDLTKAITEALDQAERQAWACPPYPWKANAEGDAVLAADDIEVMDGFALSNNQLRAVVAFSVANDPASVLRSVAADRRVLERHKPYWFSASTDYGSERHCDRCSDRGDYDWPCPEISDLADRWGVDVTNEGNGT